jgi:hypothetical protein
VFWVPRTCVLGKIQPSLRDWFCSDLYPALRAGLGSAVPAGLISVRFEGWFVFGGCHPLSRSKQLIWTRRPPDYCRPHPTNLAGNSGHTRSLVSQLIHHRFHVPLHPVLRDKAVGDAVEEHQVTRDLLSGGLDAGEFSLVDSRRGGLRGMRARCSVRLSVRRLRDKAPGCLSKWA